MVKSPLQFRVVAGQLKVVEPIDDESSRVWGDLTMHGVTRDETATAKVRLTDKGTVSVKANFKVSLPAYKVSVPSVVRLKVNDSIDLNVMLSVKPK